MYPKWGEHLPIAPQIPCPMRLEKNKSRAKILSPQLKYYSSIFKLKSNLIVGVGKTALIELLLCVSP